MWLPSPEQIGRVVEFVKPGTIEKAKNFVTEGTDVLRHGRPLFLVFGPGGTGKTTLARYLKTLELSGLPLDYNVSTLTEETKMHGKFFSRVKTFPGQHTRFENEFQTHLKEIQGASRIVCILCFSYGYRSVSLRDTESRRSPQGPLARQEELDYAQDVLHFLSFKKLDKYRIWFVINKQDLWWDEQPQVDSFYGTHLDPIFETFAGKVGQFNFSREVFPLALVRKNLTDATGTNFKQQCPSFDDALRADYIKYFDAHVRSFNG